ncbi:thiamine diphosphate-binding protein [Dipodascopsis tothii]|uniref:thiamine diphosphate-binding protein n=1 Tax=Dipodascopsis tothii TaxID=44089 RepID=UPI0034CD0F54
MATIPLGQYLFARIHQLGITQILGVPGDFNMTLLDHIFAVDGLGWVGCCNELNAAYAADGYGRVTGLPGVVVTTYGVGELSAINGVAGAFAEHVPLLHIVGTPGRPQIEQRMWMHHTIPANADFESPDHEVYARMSAPVRCASAFLRDPKTLVEDIDRVLFTIWRKSLPGYVFVPLDIVNWPVPVAALDSKLELKIVNEDEKLEDALVDEIEVALLGARRPALLVDLLARRHRSRELVMELVSVTGYPSFSTDLAKGFVDEDHPAFVGQYNGVLSRPGVREALEDSDVVLNIGPIISDNNTGAFTRNVPEEKLIVLHPSYVSIRGTVHRGLHFLPILAKLVARLKATDPVRLAAANTRAPGTIAVGLPPVVESPADISISWFYPTIGAKFLRANDIVFADSGTAQYAINDATFPKNVNFTTQLYYSSIGFALPAALGACVGELDARKSLGFAPSRVILFEGDGSSMMTIQELTTITRHGFNPVIFLINNSGYTIERAIHGPHALYNDISPNWKWTKLFETFGADPDRYVCTTVRTKAELETLIADPAFQDSPKARFVEVIMDKLDIPWRLSKQVAITADKTNKLFADYKKAHGE